MLLFVESSAVAVVKKKEGWRYLVVNAFAVSNATSVSGFEQGAIGAEKLDCYGVVTVDAKMLIFYIGAVKHGVETVLLGHDTAVYGE